MCLLYKIHKQLMKLILKDLSYLLDKLNMLFRLDIDLLDKVNKQLMKSNLQDLFYLMGRLYMMLHHFH
jgi:hypothetical protein